MDISDLVQDINAIGVVASVRTGLVVGAFIGYFDKKPIIDELAKSTAALGCIFFAYNNDGCLLSNMGEATVDYAFARLGVEMGYRALQRFVYKRKII